MMENIKHILSEIEKDNKIKILYACETGSRAWGFPSPDSDFDVRFIYMHHRDWYLSLHHQKDTIEVMNGDLDITGWDLRKALTLLKRSNAPLIERFNSPMQYFADPRFETDFKELITKYYSPIAAFFHHHSLAKKFWEELKDQQEFKLKTYFYLVRSLLSCNWIIRDGSVVPMHIEGLMQYIEDDYKLRLRKLIVLKGTVGEKYMHQRDGVLNDWILQLMEQVEAGKQNLLANKTGIGLLNNFFLKMVYAEGNN